MLVSAFERPKKVELPFYLINEKSMHTMKVWLRLGKLREVGQDNLQQLSSIPDFSHLNISLKAFPCGTKNLFILITNYTNLKFTFQ